MGGVSWATLITLRYDPLRKRQIAIEFKRWHYKRGANDETLYLQPHLYTISRLMRLCVNFYYRKKTHDRKTEYTFSTWIIASGKNQHDTP